VTGDQLVEWMAGHDWGPETLHSTRSALRGFYGWALDSGRTDRDPSRALRRIRLPQHLPRPAGDATVDAALARADDKTRLMILLAALAGLRASEIARLRWDDLDGAALVVRGKGGKLRRVPLHPELSNALDNEHAHRLEGRTGTGYRYVHGGATWIFPGQTAGPMHPGHVSHVLSAALGDGVTGHQLRHRFGSRAYARGGRDLRAVQQLLGHASPTTTAIYTAYSDSALTDAVLGAG
jgi:integrase